MRRLHAELFGIFEPLRMTMPGPIHHQHPVRICEPRRQRPGKFPGIGRRAVDHQYDGAILTLFQDMHIGTIDADALTDGRVLFADPIGIKRTVRARGQRRQTQNGKPR